MENERIVIRHRPTQMDRLGSHVVVRALCVLAILMRYDMNGSGAL